MLRAIRIATDARLAEFNLKYAEVAEFNGLTVSETFGEMIEEALNDVVNTFLYHACLIADAHNQVTFGQMGHALRGISPNKEVEWICVNGQPLITGFFVARLRLRFSCRGIAE